LIPLLSEGAIYGAPYSQGGDLTTPLHRPSNLPVSKDPSTKTAEPYVCFDDPQDSTTAAYLMNGRSMRESSTHTTRRMALPSCYALPSL